MNAGRRWQSYANPFAMSPAGRRAWQIRYEVNEDDQNAASFQLSLRDAHDDGLHAAGTVPGCVFCARGKRVA